MTHFRRMIFDFRSWAGRVAGFPTLSKSEPKPGKAGSEGRAPGKWRPPPVFPCLLTWEPRCPAPRKAAPSPIPSPAQPASCSTVTSLYTNKEDRQTHHSR